jgi:hypothetical protein
VRQITPADAPQRPDLRQYVAMPDLYRAPGGWHVSIVTLTCTPDRHDGSWIRISRYGTWVADIRSIAELGTKRPPRAAHATRPGGHRPLQRLTSDWLASAEAFHPLSNQMIHLCLARCPSEPTVTADHGTQALGHLLVRRAVRSGYL